MTTEEKKHKKLTLDELINKLDENETLYRSHYNNANEWLEEHAPEYVIKCTEYCVNSALYHKTLAKAHASISIFCIIFMLLFCFGMIYLF